MTADEQALLTLLRSLLAWVPGPKTWTAALSQPGEGGSIEQARCPACKGDGRAEAVRGPNSMTSPAVASR